MRYLSSTIPRKGLELLRVTSFLSILVRRLSWPSFQEGSSNDSVLGVETVRLLRELQPFQATLKKDDLFFRCPGWSPHWKQWDVTEGKGKQVGGR